MDKKQAEQFKKYGQLPYRELVSIAEQEGADPVALYALAERYVEQDRKPWEIFPFYMAAAQKGLPDAQNMVGCCYEIGDGVEQDYRQAAAWYRKAADQGFAESQYNFGYCYEKGYGVAKDERRAAVWYKKAAGQGHNLAQYYLGEMYEHGFKGGKQNLKKACALFILAEMNEVAGIVADRARWKVEDGSKLSKLATEFKNASAKSGVPLEEYLKDIAGLTPVKAGATSPAAANADPSAAPCG